ncbi:MAG: hypothetical protein V1820_03315 [archaeon]
MAKKDEVKIVNVSLFEPDSKGNRRALSGAAKDAFAGENVLIVFYKGSRDSYGFGEPALGNPEAVIELSQAFVDTDSRIHINGFVLDGIPSDLPKRYDLKQAELDRAARVQKGYSLLEKIFKGTTEPVFVDSTGTKLTELAPGTDIADGTLDTVGQLAYQLGSQFPKGNQAQLHVSAEMRRDWQGESDVLVKPQNDYFLVTTRGPATINFSRANPYMIEKSVPISPRILNVCVEDIPAPSVEPNAPKFLLKIPGLGGYIQGSANEKADKKIVAELVRDLGYALAV